MSTTETLKPSDFGETPQAVLPKLRLVCSPEHGLRSRPSYPLAVGETALGRELPGADGIEIHDARISRVHAILRVSPALELSVFDNGSKNGTFVNRCPVSRGESVALTDGDVLRVGDSFLVVRHESLHPVDGDVPGLLGQAPSMAALRREIRRVAPDRATVLIQGETGTGKELVAKALHDHSDRRGDFIAVNCGAIPETLAESVLFGHVAGAFTGAKGQAGLFSAAHGGTLFLDEIGELSPVLQPKLLRAIQDRAVTPVGATRPIACDVRLVSATHRALTTAVAEGRFREDLYGRLAGILVRLPALRERREDILILLDHALAGARPALAPDLVEMLLLYPWPQNVREVTQVADHLRLLGADAALRQRLTTPPASAAAPLPPPATPVAAAPADVDGDSDVDGDEADAPRGRREAPLPDRDQLLALMTEHRGVILRVAAVLGCSRRHVGRLLELHRLNRNDFRR